MQNPQHSLPASLSVATPPAQRRVKRAASSFALDSGLRSWAHGRYNSKSQLDLLLPIKPQPQNATTTTWLAWSKDALLPNIPLVASDSNRPSAASNEPIKLPAFEARPSSRDNHSSFVIPPLSVHRRSMEADLLALRRDDIRRPAQTEPRRTRRSSHSPRQPSNSRNDLTVMTREAAAPRSSPVHASFPDPLRTNQVLSVAINFTSRLNTNLVVRTEPEQFVSPIDGSLFAAAIGSLDFSFPASPPSPMQSPPLLHTQSSPHPRPSSNRNSALLQPSRRTPSQRARSMSPRRTSQRGHNRDTSGSIDGQMAAVVHEPSHTLLMLESLGLNDTSSHDDELPDYETSQAEACAARRKQAAQRARELEQRWQQSWARGRTR